MGFLIFFYEQGKVKLNLEKKFRTIKTSGPMFIMLLCRLMILASKL